MRITFREVVITLELGDITRHEADGIVNAANSGLMGGGGVDGAIHRAGGPDILDECREIRTKRGSLPPGDAVMTTAGALPVEKVIHTVGPMWRGGCDQEPSVLTSCYQRSLAEAEAAGLRTVAFPSISTGVYGYPLERAAAVAVDAVIAYLDAHSTAFDRITWVLFDQETFEAYARALVSVSSLPLDADERR